MAGRKPQRADFKERSFGVSVGGVLIAVAAVLWWRGRIDYAAILGGIGAVLVVLGLTAPRLLKYPSAAWWKFAMVLGYVNARVILIDRVRARADADGAAVAADRPRSAGAPATPLARVVTLSGALSRSRSLQADVLR